MRHRELTRAVLGQRWSLEVASGVVFGGVSSLLQGLDFDEVLPNDYGVEHLWRIDLILGVGLFYLM
jgi:hypothetical protein